MVESGLRFIERSVPELRNDPTMSVAHFATGLELLLKARLFAVHWSLIANRPHECSWSSLRSGEVVTLQASELCTTITTTTGTPLAEQRVIFDAVFKHRNRVLHWLPSVNVEDVAAEQCRAWHSLHQLLTGPWKEYYIAQQTRIRSVDRNLLKHRAYLQARFETFERRQGRLQQTGALRYCPSCGYCAAVASEPRLALTAIVCRVCEADGYLAKFECGNWVSLLDMPIDCECGTQHAATELAEQLDPGWAQLQRTEYQDTEPLKCGECHSAAPVVTFNGQYACLGCGQVFSLEEVSCCEICGSTWVGYDTDDSGAQGCPRCSWEE